MPQRIETPARDSELAALRAQVERLERELEHARRLALLGTLTGSIAHEFNNILTPILTYAEMSRLNPGDLELGRKAVDRAAVGAERASKIAAAILALAGEAPSSGAPPAADVAAAVNDALTCIGRDDSTDQIEVLVQVRPGLVAAIEPVALQHVLLNLILNARKAMNHSGGRLVIRSYEVGQSSTWNIHRSNTVVLEVEDTGCGIAPQFLDKVFRSFVSLSDPSKASGHSDRKQRHRGTGLGLAISKQLVERAGGSIAARSVVGVGTCITIQLLEAEPASAALRVA